MIDIEPIDFPGIDSIRNNIEFYKNKFLSDNIVVFKNAHCDDEMQNEIGEIFGIALDCSQPTNQDRVDFYIEDHHNHIDNSPDAGKDDILLHWHIEHVVRDRSHSLGVWNMQLFKCDKDSGKTYFVDMVNLYDSLSKEDQDFVDKAIVTLYYTEEDKENTINEEEKGMDSYKEKSFTYSLSKRHWVTNKKGLRIVFGGSPTLTLFDDRTPTEEEIAKCNTLLQKIEQEATQNEDVRMVLRWEEGYLAIPDLFKLAHSVTGGFEKEERRLKGIFYLEGR
jgi:alpha-ketoglutarate-dependent taurine dioxygenase